MSKNISFRTYLDAIMKPSKANMTTEYKWEPWHKYAWILDTTEFSEEIANLKNLKLPHEEGIILKLAELMKDYITVQLPTNPSRSLLALLDHINFEEKAQEALELYDIHYLKGV